MKKILLYLLLITLSYSVHASYVDKAVLSHVRISGQHDTIGFNLAQQLPDFIYEQLKRGKLDLWDSPAKNAKLNFLALEQIEESSNTEFKNCSDIFLYEFWDCSRRSLRFVIAGFSFVYYKDETLKPYGFIDAKEAFRLLATNYIPVNPNAPADLTYWEAINSKRFKFTIVQYGNKDFTSDPLKSVELKKDIFNGKRSLDPNVQWKPSKNIRYELVEDYTKEYDAAINLKQGLESFINKNRDWVRKKDKGYFYKNAEYKDYFTITGVHVYETWEKRGNVLLSFVDSVVLFVNNKQLRAYTNEDLRQMNLRIRFKSIIDILKEKSFNLNILEINRVLIEPDNQELYKTALEQYNWTQLTEYVKYENTK